MNCSTSTRCANFMICWKERSKKKAPHRLMQVEMEAGLCYSLAGHIARLLFSYPSLYSTRNRGGYSYGWKVYHALRSASDTIGLGYDSFPQQPRHNRRGAAHGNGGGLSPRQRAQLPQAP